MNKLIGIMKRILAVGLLALVASAPAPQPTTGVVVPQGWVADVYLQIPGPASFRRVDGEFLIGAYNGIWSDTTQIAQGSFFAVGVDRAPDGTLYAADVLGFPSAVLWRFAPAQQIAGYGFKYCMGVEVLPDGTILAVDAGFIAYSGADGKICVANGGGHVSTMPSAIATPLYNPASIESGSDGWIYVVERGFIGFADGKIYRFQWGDSDAELFVGGLADPFDFAFAPDGSMFITDGTSVLRRLPDGSLETWATGFVAPHGIDVAPNGDVFVADLAGIVYRIHPAAVPVAMTIEPQTLNLKSQGQTVLAKFGEDVATAAIVAIDGVAVSPIPALSLSPAKFDRAQLIQVLTAGDRLVRVEGALADGTPYYAEAVVKAIK